MKIRLKPLYSRLNPGVGSCPLGCQQVCQVHQAAPSFKPLSGCSCPLSLHQAETGAEVLTGDADIIFNTANTGDGKSLAGSLPGLLDPKFRTVSLYPTIELVKDQENQVRGYCQSFTSAKGKQIDSLYGAELAKRTQKKKGRKFRELLRSIKQTHVLLTNPDIFYLVNHSRYVDPAYGQDLLPFTLAQYPHLYICDEFHIFGAHEEAAILNSLLLIRHTRRKKSPFRVLFTSATPKTRFIETLNQAKFKVAEVPGNYVSQPTPGYRPIAQAITLEFVELKESDSLAWLTEQANTLKQILQAEKKGRGLIILNSVAVVSRVVRQLQALLGNEVIVKEISGRIDGRERDITRDELAQAEQPVLVIATSAVDVGVDFKIHLLIFETSDSATFIQRLGRLGRHPGFQSYQAFALIPGWMSWILPQLKKYVAPDEMVDRTQFREEIIEKVFDAPQEYEQYRRYWGALQAQGMLLRLSGTNIQSKREGRERSNVTERLRDRISQDLRNIYGEQLDKKRGHWFALGKNKTGQAVQEELLRFRGGSDLQAAVWDDSRFYTYGLLRLLPHTQVEVIDRKTFLEAAAQQDYPSTEFPEPYLTTYLKVQSWSEQRYDLKLDCDLGTDELTSCTLTRIKGVSVEGHPQSSQLRKSLRKQPLLTFLVPLSRQHPTLWNVRNILRLSPTFGLYLLHDADDEAYACAFNQDALLLESLKWKLKRCDRSKPYIY